MHSNRCTRETCAQRLSLRAPDHPAAGSNTPNSASIARLPDRSHHSPQCACDVRSQRPVRRGVTFGIARLTAPKTACRRARHFESVENVSQGQHCTTVMILPKVHLRKPCYDFYFLQIAGLAPLLDKTAAALSRSHRCRSKELNARFSR